MYSYDLDFSLNINKNNLTEQEFNVYHDDVKKIALYASYFINYIISSSDIITQKLNNNLMEYIFNTINIHSSNLVGVELFGKYKYHTEKITNSNNYINIDHGFLYHTRGLNKIFKVIDKKQINDIFKESYHKCLKNFDAFGIAYDTTYDWPNCEFKVINTVINLYIPFIIIYKDDNGNFISKYIKTNIVDISIDNFTDTSQISTIHEYVEYEYTMEKLNFYGQSMSALMDQILSILFYNCKDPSNLFLFKNKKANMRMRHFFILSGMEIFNLHFYIMYFTKNTHLLIAS